MASLYRGYPREHTISSMQMLKWGLLKTNFVLIHSGKFKGFYFGKKITAIVILFDGLVRSLQ